MSLKLWLRVGALVVLYLALSTTIAVAQDHGHGHDKHGRDDDERGDDHDKQHGHGHDHARGHGRYHDNDKDIRNWYHAHYSHLPPGLAKRDRLPPGLERQLVVNGTLPPGLQKKMQPCPRELEAVLPPPPANYTHVFIGGNLVLVNRVSFRVADVFHFEASF
jgi:Ni/Co efflux regulator RcnB